MTIWEIRTKRESGAHTIRWLHLHRRKQSGLCYQFPESGIIRVIAAQVRQMNKLLGAQLAESLTLPDCTPREDKEKNDRFKFCEFPVRRAVRRSTYTSWTFCLHVIFVCFLIVKLRFQVGKGADSFLIIGNSYALSPGKLVLEHLKSHYGKIAIRAVPRSFSLFSVHICQDRWWTNGAFETYVTKHFLRLRTSHFDEASHVQEYTSGASEVPRRRTKGAAGCSLHLSAVIITNLGNLWLLISRAFSRLYHL